ncbi:thiolase family protein [Phytoactinopolyspora limicola]|uniref:thiolase family protein n=1 Tax=Phytoactinopolyspora limicola TaxID=2715536 RepID=UPI00140844D6|nr:thiolase family protein [Phytoactinopolyspora limicola]
MRDVVIVGADMTPFGKHLDRSVGALGAEAVLGALKDAGAERSQIDAVYSGNVTGGMLVGQRAVRDLGLGGIPVVNIENACSSSAAALREAYVAVGSGLHNTVVVLGVEKLTALGGGPLPLDDADHEVANGQMMPAIYAMRARRYLSEYGLSPTDLAAVAVKARRHGARNPYAYLRTETTVDDVLASRPIATPLTLFQCCPSGDGAAALVVTAAERAPTFEAPAVRIRASVLHSGEFRTGFRDMTSPDITVHSAQEAYEQAGIGPDDIDVIELHDAFTIAELLYYEALGLAERGRAAALLHSGATTFGGSTVVNPSGGLLAKGHPIGATGAAQAVEIVWQLRDQAEQRQVDGARLGLIHATGGGLSGVDHGACAVHILEAPRKQVARG